MPLDRYTDQCLALAAELAESLTEAEIGIVRGGLTEMGLAGWLRFCVAHADAIAAYVAATPAQRRRSVAWRQARLELTLAAYQHCQKAAVLLHQAAQLLPGCSYRRMAAEAGAAYDRLEADPPEDWPWGDPNPFDAM